MKLRIICKSKIHHAVVTRSDLHYIGSIGIDRALMDLTDTSSRMRPSTERTDQSSRLNP